MNDVKEDKPKGINRSPGEDRSIREERLPEPVEDALLGRLEAADPAKGEELSSWAESEEGREVLDRLLQKCRETPEVESQAQPVAPVPMRRPRFPRVAWVGAAFVVVVALAVTFIVLRDQSIEMAGVPPTTVAGTTTTSAAAETTTTAAGATTTTARVMATPATPDTRSPATTAAAAASTGPERPITVLEALQNLVVMAEVAAGGPMERPDSQADIYAQVRRDGQAFGVLSQSEAEELQFDGTVRRATYAVWLWRALAERLPPVTEVTFTDLAGLSAEEQQAIKGLAQAGMIQGDSSGAFHPEDELTAADEETILRRVVAVIGRAP